MFILICVNETECSMNHSKGERTIGDFKVRARFCAFSLFRCFIMFQVIDGSFGIIRKRTLCDTIVLLQVIAVTRPPKIFESH
jgi:hypothetical protein